MKQIFIGIVYSLCIIAIWNAFQGSFSPFITQTNPVFGDPEKPAYGYSYFYDEDLLHKENFYPLKQIDLLQSGNPGKQGAKRSFTDRRIAYAVIGNMLSPFLTPVEALRLINLIAFFLSALLIYLYSNAIFPDKTIGALATGLYIFSIAPVMFVGDLSPHLLGNCCFFFFVYRLHQIWQQGTNWRETIGLCCFLGFWACTYPSAGYGAALFFLVLLRKREPLKALTPVATRLLMPALQLKFIEYFGIRYGANTEALYFKNGLFKQFEALLDSPSNYLLETIRAFLGFVLIDNFLVVLLGLLGLCIYSKRDRLFHLMAFALPILIVLPVYMASTARAYIVSGGAIIIFPFAAFFLLSLANRSEACTASTIKQKSGQLIAILAVLCLIIGAAFIFWPIQSFVLILLITFLTLAPALLTSPSASKKTKQFSLMISFFLLFGVQIFWSLGSAFQLPTPASHFVRGAFSTNQNGIFLEKQPGILFRSNYLNYSEDISSIPQSLGGKLSWSAFIKDADSRNSASIQSKAQGKSSESEHSPPRSLQGIFIQAPTLICILLSVVLLTPRLMGTLAVTLITVLVSIGVMFGHGPALEKEKALYLDQNISLRGGQTLRAHVTLSKSFVDRLKSLSKSYPDSQVDCYLNMSKIKRGTPVFKVFGKRFPESVRGKPGSITISSKQFFRFLSQEKNRISFELEFEGPSEASMYIGSWKRLSKLTNRSLVISESNTLLPAPDWFPAFEIRLRDQFGFFHLIGT